MINLEQRLATTIFTCISSLNLSICYKYMTSESGVTFMGFIILIVQSILNIELHFDVHHYHVFCMHKILIIFNHQSYQSISCKHIVYKIPWVEIASVFLQTYNISHVDLSIKSFSCKFGSKRWKQHLAFLCALYNTKL